MNFFPSNGQQSTTSLRRPLKWGHFVFHTEDVPVKFSFFLLRHSCQNHQIPRYLFNTWSEKQHFYALKSVFKDVNRRLRFFVRRNRSLRTSTNAYIVSKIRSLPLVFVLPDRRLHNVTSKHRATFPHRLLIAPSVLCMPPWTSVMFKWVRGRLSR